MLKCHDSVASSYVYMYRGRGQTGDAVRQRSHYTTLVAIWLQLQKVVRLAVLEEFFSFKIFLSLAGRLKMIYSP
jgi:hypothetical protein